MNKTIFKSSYGIKIRNILKKFFILLQIVFIKLKIFKIFLAISNLLIKIIYFSKLGNWIENQKNSYYSDFPNLDCKWENRYKLYSNLLDKFELSKIEITYLEFGVFQGDSIKWWVMNNKNIKSEFYGFDTFEGLPSDWGDQLKGTFNTSLKTPDIKDERCRFIIGLFQDTLKNFLKNIIRKDTCIFHLDADLYSSTLYVLLNIIEIIKKGDFIIFDEFNNYFIDNEFKALCDFLEIFDMKYELVGAVNNYSKIVLKIL